MLSRTQLATLSAQTEVEATNKDPFELDDIFDFALATTVDIGTTLVNSLTNVIAAITPLDEGTDWDTGNILQAMNEDAGRFYDQNKDLVQLASFIGGIFVPGVAAAKSFAWAKNGRTWVGGLEKTIRKSEALAGSELKEFGKRTVAYNTARDSMRMATLKSGAAEGLVYELEFAAMMNKHAYMDQDYDIADFAIGAALGGLVVPLRLMQQSKRLRAIGKEAIVPQVSAEAFTPPIHLQGKDAGQTLSYKGTLYNNWKIDDTANSSKEIKDFHEKAGYEHINGISFQINQMAKKDPSLQARINFIVPKGQAPTPRSFDFDDAYNATPDEYLGKMSVSDPAALSGVETFVHYSAESPMFSTMDNIVTRAGTGELEAISGQVAKNTLFSKFTSTAVRSYDELLESIPEGVALKGPDQTEIVIGIKEIDRATRKWMAEYVSLPGFSTKPIKFTGPGAKSLSTSDAAIAKEATWKEMAATLTHKEFVPHSKLIDQLAPLQASSRAAIADPYYGMRIISEVDALAGAGVNAYPSIKINASANMSTKLGMNPFGQSVAISDKAYHEAMIAVSTLPKGIKQIQLDTSSDDVIPFLQAIINRYKVEEATWPTVLSKDSSVTFTKVAEAAEWLWKEKQAIVAAGKAAGASPVQIARVANLSVETTETVLSARGAGLPIDGSLPIARYSTTDQAKYYDQRPIQLEGKIGSYGQVEELAVTSMLDKEMLTNAHMATVTNIIDTSGVPQLAKYLKEVAYTSVTKAMREQLPSALASLENKWNMVTSADHAYRELGEFGSWITAYGSDMSTYVNKHIDMLDEAITSTLSAVAQEPASRLQFSQLRQALHAIPIEEATKLRYDAETGKIISGVIDGAPTYLKYYGKEQEIVLTTQMKNFMTSWLPVQQELLGVYNSSRQLNGLPKSKGAGIWFPYSELNKDMIAYKVSNPGQPFSVELITARNAKELAENVAEANQLYGETHKIVTKADSASWNQINRYSDIEQFKVADLASRKKGITSGSITPGYTDIDNFKGSIQREMWNQYRRIDRAANSQLHDSLDFFAQREIAATGGGKGFLGQKVQRKVSLPELVSKTMLNESMVHDAPMLDMANNWTTVVINTAFDKTNTAWNAVTRKSKGTAKDFESLTEALKKADVPMPYPNQEAYVAALKKGKIDDVALHRIQQSQSVLVMLNLRLLETAHAMVTTASLPVILQGELASVTGKGGVTPLKHMIEATKFWASNTPEAMKLKAYAKDRKYVVPIVAETTRAMQDFHTNVNFFSKHKKILNKLTFFSDFSEGWVREQAFANGYLIAKTKNPKAPMELLAAEAYAFTSRTMGNYVPRQRPTMFQGTFGAMIGLYQTFMLTMGQNMFRYLEAGDAKAMRNLWGAQGSMFGLESLPMFQQFNQLLGGYVSDDHEDIRSTVYDVFGDDSDQSRSMAEYVLFGAPSAMFGSAIYTRGALDPRSPLTATGQSGIAFKPAIYDAAVQSGKLVGNLIQATGDEDMGRAILQGFAAQSLWRPAARYSELALGASFDQKGELISGTEEVREPFAVFSRVFGARPLKEQALRNLRFSNTYYNQIDRDRRARYTKELRRIVTSEPDMGRVDELFVDFIGSPGGTYRGWKQIYNDAYMAVDTPYAERLVSDTKRQPVIQQIVDTYAQ